MKKASALGVVFLVAVACGNAAQGVEACRRIETERCKWAQSCGLPLDTPVRRADETSPVDDCIRYYRDTCMHGTVAAIQPTEAETTACVDAIHTGVCSIVLAPETSPACLFLVPVDAGVDAADATDAADGG